MISGHGPSSRGEENGFWGCYLSVLKLPSIVGLTWRGNKNLSLRVLYHTQEVTPCGSGKPSDYQEACLREFWEMVRLIQGPDLKCCGVVDGPVSFQEVVRYFSATNRVHSAMSFVNCSTTANRICATLFSSTVPTIGSRYI